MSKRKIGKRVERRASVAVECLRTCWDIATVHGTSARDIRGIVTEGAVLVHRRAGEEGGKDGQEGLREGLP
jgi:hypothetical protein